MRISSPSRWLLVVCCLWMPVGAIAAELLYLSSPYCPPCLKFESEISTIYSKTEEARVAPLRKVNIADMDQAEIRLLLADTVELKGDIHGMPTFILVNKGQEVDRFSGYTNGELFWMSLQRLLNQLN